MRLSRWRWLDALTAIALILPAHGCGRIGYGVSGERDADQAAGDASMDAALRDGALRDGALRDGALRDAVAMPPSGCTAMIADDFEDGIVAPEWFRFEQPPSNVVESGGELVFVTAASSADTPYSGYSLGPVPVDGHYAAVELRRAPDPSSNAQLLLSFIDVAQIYVEQGLILFRSHASRTLLTEPFDPALHRWWRIRHDAAASELLWETSPDLMTWTIWLREPLDAASIKIDIASGTYRAEALTTTSALDNFSYGTCP